jgi:nucleotide-binding universal stress UspA family protein
MTSDAEPRGRRIVVGIDGSAAAAAALAWAFGEAVLRDAVLHVVHAWEPPARGRAPYAPGPCDLGPEAGRHAAEALLAAAVRHAYHAAGLVAGHQPGLRAGPQPGQFTGDQPGLRVEAVEGLPAKVLLDRACGAELLVLGGLTAAPAPGGHQPGDHVSPVALACLRASSCPVVVVTSPVVPVSASPALLASPARG